MADVGASAVGVFTEVKDRQLKPFSFQDYKNSSGQPASGVFPSNSRPVLGSGGFQVGARQPLYLASDHLSIAPTAAYGMAWASGYSTQFWSATADTSLRLLGGKARITGILGYGGYTVKSSTIAPETRHGFNGGIELAIRVARRLNLVTRTTTTITGDGPQTIVSLGLNWLFSDPPSPSSEEASKTSSRPTGRIVPAGHMEPQVSAGLLEAQRAIGEAERLLGEAELPTAPWFREFLAEASAYGWAHKSIYAEQRAVFDCLNWMSGPREWKTARLRPLSHILRDLDAAIRVVEAKGDVALRARAARFRKRADGIGIKNAHAVATILSGQGGELRWRSVGVLIRNAITKVKSGDVAQQEVLARHIQDFEDILVLVTRNVSLLIPLVSVEERTTLHQLNAALQCLREGGANCRKEDTPISVSGLKVTLTTIKRLGRSAKPK